MEPGASAASTQSWLVLVGNDQPVMQSCSQYPSERAAATANEVVLFFALRTKQCSKGCSTRGDLVAVSCWLAE